MRPPLEERERERERGRGRGRERERERERETILLFTVYFFKLSVKALAEESNGTYLHINTLIELLMESISFKNV